MHFFYFGSLLLLQICWLTNNHVHVQYRLCATSTHCPDCSILIENSLSPTPLPIPFCTVTASSGISKVLAFNQSFIQAPLAYLQHPSCLHILHRHTLALHHWNTVAACVHSIKPKLVIRYTLNCTFFFFFLFLSLHLQLRLNCKRGFNPD